MPQQSRPGGFAGSATPPASTLPSGGGTKTITTAGGGTITIGAKGGSSQTGSGATIGGAGVGMKIETAHGQTIVKGKGTVGVTNGTNAAVHRGSVTGVQGAGGTAVNIRGGTATSSGYRQGGSITAVQGRGGYTAVNVRGGYGAGGTGHVGSVTAIRGPGGNVVAAGRGAAFAHGQFVGGRSWTAVNGAFTGWNYFTPTWRAAHPGLWWPGKWATIGAVAWTTASWGSASAYCGCGGEPVYYDYGENVVYQDDIVYYGDQPVATAEESYAQASQIAAEGETPQNDDWLPLGVFAVVTEGQTKTDKVVQLALNKEGRLRGNYYDKMAGKTMPVVGAVDKKTQRVALTLEGNHAVVVETGLYDLTNDEVPVLVHFGPDHQEPRTLIRLQQPEARKSDSEG